MTSKNAVLLKGAPASLWLLGPASVIRIDVEGGAVGAHALPRRKNSVIIYKGKLLSAPSQAEKDVNLLRKFSVGGGGLEWLI